MGTNYLQTGQLVVVKFRYLQGYMGTDNVSAFDDSGEFRYLQGYMGTDVAQLKVKKMLDLLNLCTLT